MSGEPRILGVLGGMGWASTLEAYRQLNVAVGQARGGDHGAELLIRSVDFATIHQLQQVQDWDGAGRLLADAAVALEGAGAGALLLCTNTMHRVAPAITAATSIPLLHIADATAAAIHEADLSRIGLLGTRFTMEGAFYADRLRAHGVEILVPEEADRAALHRVIYDELITEVIRPSSRERFLTVIDRLVARGAEGVIAGCTEIELLVTAEHVDVPWFPTTQIHTAAGVGWLLDGRLPPVPPSRPEVTG